MIGLGRADELEPEYGPTKPERRNNTVDGDRGMEAAAYQTPLASITLRTDF